jgi:hypothetical protein
MLSPKQLGSRIARLAGAALTAGAATLIAGAATLGTPATARAAARSLQPVSVAPDHPLPRLTRSVTRAELGRDLFGDPAGAALVGQVEIFDRYPYVRARYIQLVTDAAWNRVVFGEPGAAIHAFDGAGTALGRLRGPAGIDRDPQGRVFVADALNDRIVVLELRGDGDDLRLEPRFAIGGLKRPTGVSWDGGTTPLDSSDDQLWVADTGNHRIVGFALSATGAEQVAVFGNRGNGDGHFLEPRDLEVGRAFGLHSRDLYVADWGNGRIVRLIRSGEADSPRISWAASRRVADVRSVATDAWGNVYVVRRDDAGDRIAKLNPEFDPLVESEPDFPGLRDLSVGFLTVTDHRTNTRTFTGYASLFALEAWGETSGARRLELGIEALDLAIEPAGAGGNLHYLLTDHANVEVSVAVAGRTVRRESLGRLAAGRQAWTWDGRDAVGRPIDGPATYEVRAQSLYPGGATAVATVGIGGAPGVGGFAVIERVSPNPANPATQIRYSLPGAARDLRLEIVDVNGRLRRRLVSGQAVAGPHVADWDGTDGSGRRVSSGTYFVRLQVDGRQSAVRKLTVVR